MAAVSRKNVARSFALLATRAGVVCAACIVAALASPVPKLTHWLGSDAWARVLEVPAVILGARFVLALLGLAGGKLAFLGISFEPTTRLERVREGIDDVQAVERRLLVQIGQALGKIDVVLERVAVVERRITEVEKR